VIVNASAVNSEATSAGSFMVSFLGGWTVAGGEARGNDERG
jgi:hypothetical protein